MNRAMGASEVDEVEDAQDKILAAMRSRKMRGNAPILRSRQLPKTLLWRSSGKSKPMVHLNLSICIQ
ncbi:type I restriction-modification system [Vibrio sp. JCM 19236]|nr:type I restriction-modification system [Vibrio sp. JCM 19236]